jgi:peptidoglycan hydrolase-like protein with peptidoglycan-binding domain
VYTGYLRLFAVPVSVALFASLAFSAWAAGPQTSTPKSAAKKKSVAAKAAPTKAVAKAAPAKAATSKAPVKSAATTAATKRTPVTKRPVAVVAHHSPQQPAPERLKEIQQALASKGYFESEPDGNWGTASVVALKHFQHDQNLQEDGKIGSLSLIALGLGPKRELADMAPKTVEPEQKNP